MADLFQYYNTGDDGFYGIWGDKIYGQQFTVATSHSIEYIKLKMKKYGSSKPGNLVVEIKATDGDGKPTGDALCSTVVNASEYDDVSRWRTITFSNPANLYAGNMYAILCRDEDWDGSSTIQAQWARDKTSPTYSDGVMLYSGNQGSSWSIFSGEDFMFEEWGTEIAETGGMLPAVAPVLEEMWGW